MADGALGATAAVGRDGGATPDGAGSAPTAPLSPPRTAARMRGVVSGRASLVLALAVLTVALAVGGGIGTRGHQTAAQRATAIETQIRCPSCQDLSVAQSPASSAVAVRHEIRHLVGAGESTRAIEARLVAQYGPSILLAPPATGLSLVVWLLPAVGGLLAIGAVALVLARRTAAWRRLEREASR